MGLVLLTLPAPQARELVASAAEKGGADAPGGVPAVASAAALLRLAEAEAAAAAGAGAGAGAEAGGAAGDAEAGERRAGRCGCGAKMIFFS